MPRLSPPTWHQTAAASPPAPPHKLSSNRCRRIATWRSCGTDRLRAESAPQIPPCKKADASFEAELGLATARHPCGSDVSRDRKHQRRDLRGSHKGFIQVLLSPGLLG